MPTPSPIFAMAMSTMGSTLGLALWSLMRTEQSIKEDENDDDRS